jgi:hypothetical protein
MFCLKSKTTNCVIIGILWISLGACNNRVNNTPLFYAIDSLVSAQVDHLNKSGASITKITSLDGEKSSNTYVPGDSAGWNKELEIFRQLDLINKPVNQGLYKTDVSVDDDGAVVKAFTAIEDELPVEVLRLRFVDRRLLRIEAQLREENSMYHSSRTLSMDFKQHHGLPLVTSYALVGGQKMFLGDSVRYDIMATISLLD